MSAKARKQHHRILPTEPKLEPLSEAIFMSQLLPVREIGCKVEVFWLRMERIFTDGSEANDGWTMWTGWPRIGGRTCPRMDANSANGKSERERLQSKTLRD